MSSLMRSLKQSFESIAGCGITRAKTSYIIGLAEKSTELLEFDWSLDSDIVMKHLVKFRELDLGLLKW